MKKIIVIILLVLAICFGAFILSGLSGGRDITVTEENILTMPIKNYDEYLEVCSEENVLKAKENSQPDLRELFGKKDFKRLFVGLTEHYVNEVHTSKLYKEEGCYLSVCGINYFDAASNSGSNVRQCFIFTRDLEEAGVIRFADGNTGSMSISVNDSELGGSSVVLEKLAVRRDISFVILTNGMDIKLLDGENNLASAGRSGHNLEIDGDVFDALVQKGYGVSYSDIVSEDNLVWIDFKG